MAKKVTHLIEYEDEDNELLVADCECGQEGIDPSSVKAMFKKVEPPYEVTYTIDPNGELISDDEDPRVCFYESRVPGIVEDTAGVFFGGDFERGLTVCWLKDDFLGTRLTRTVKKK